MRPYGAGSPGNETDVTASCVANAFDCDISDVDSVYNCIDSLRTQERFHEAISVTSGLSNALRCQTPIRTALGALYRDMDWHAHAFDAYGPARGLPKSSRKLRRDSRKLSRTTPLGFSRSGVRDSEHKIEEIWEKWCAERVAMLKNINVSESSYIVNARVALERNLLKRAEVHVRREKAKQWANISRSLLWSLPSAMAMTGILTNRSSYMIYAGIFFLALVIAALPPHVIGQANDEVPSVRREQRVRLAAWLSIVAWAACSILAHSVGTDWKWWNVVAEVIFYAILASWLQLGLLYRTDWIMNDLRRKSASRVILGDMLYLLKEIEDPSNMSDLQTRRKWMALLEDNAWTMEHYVPGGLSDQARVTRHWVAYMASQAAASIRVMACRIAVPELRDRSWLAENLLHEARAIAATEYGALKRESPASPMIGQKRHLQISVPFVVITTLILIMVLASALFSIRKGMAAGDTIPVTNSIVSAIILVCTLVALWRSRPR